MVLELVRGVVAEQLHAVAPLDQRLPFGDQALQFDRVDFRAILFLLIRRCACSLSSSSRSMRAMARWKRFTVDQSNSSRSGSRRVSPNVATRASKMSATAPATLRFWQRPRVWFVLEGTMAVELEFGENTIGGDEACGRSSGCRVRSSFALSFVGSTATLAAFMATKGGGRAGLAPEAQRRAETKWRMAEGRRFCSRCKAPNGRDGK